jgi:hypothetical protein
MKMEEQSILSDHSKDSTTNQLKTHLKNDDQVICQQEMQTSFTTCHADFLNSHLQRLK